MFGDRRVLSCPEVKNSMSSIALETGVGATFADAVARRLERCQKIGSDPRRQLVEKALCIKDVALWVNRWAWTFDPREKISTRPFTLFPRQEAFLRWLAARDAAQESG